jgi:hypothetical protein
MDGVLGSRSTATLISGEIFNERLQFDVNYLPLRNPQCFVAGYNFGKCWEYWDVLVFLEIIIWFSVWQIHSHFPLSAREKVGVTDGYHTPSVTPIAECAQLVFLSPFANPRKALPSYSL